MKINNNKNIIAFDFGIKYIGIAISPCITYIFKPIITYNYNGIIDWKKITYLFKKINPILILIGNPLNINKKNKHLIIKKIKNFAFKIKKKYNICVILHDERFTTKEAKIKIKNKKNYNINAIAASLILKSWMHQF